MKPLYNQRMDLTHNIKAHHAAHMLDEPFSFMGEVRHGNKLGRLWGTPTANLEADYLYPLLRGIYCVMVRRKNSSYYLGVASIGDRPTIKKGTKNVLEVHIFDFCGDLYGEVLEVTFLSKLRDEIKFSSIDALKKQIMSDITHAKFTFPNMLSALPVQQKVHKHQKMTWKARKTN
ncbi:MAG: riboflavin kinase [Legionella sp.]|uniref:riboflavin kinase n=1 Tax=Legionella sp. TaxID=459 RepID=UPI002841F8AB|nr:riboflavin kinase [Legionella sp.]